MLTDTTKKLTRFSRSALAALLAGGLLFSSALAQPGSTGELRALVQQEPDNAYAWTQLGDAYLEQAEFEAAREAFQEAIALDYRQVDAHFGLGLAEYNRGDYQAALFSFSETARLAPERFDGHYNLGVTQARLRMHAEAAESFRAALDNLAPEATFEDEFNTWLGLAGQLKLTGDFDAAAEAYEAAIEIEPDDREVRYLHAEALYRAGRGLEALPLLTDLDDSANEDYRVPALIADVYLEQGQTDYALSSLQRAIRKAEENGSASVQAGVHIRLGLLQRDLGRAADALASFQRAAAVDPASWQAHYNLGLSYLEAGRISESITPLETAVVQAPASGEARLALATAYDQAGSAAEALEQAESALSLLNDELLRVQARFLAGRSEYHLGDYQAAAGHLAIVVEARPGDPQAQLWAGLTEYQRGDYGAAAQYYERAVQLAPASREARANLAAAYLADARYTDAEFIYLELIELDPQDRQSHYNLGWALLSQNRRAAARDAFQAAAALDYAPAAEALAEYFQ